MKIRRKLFYAFIGVVAVPLVIATVLARHYLAWEREQLDQHFINEARAAIKRMNESGQARMNALRDAVHAAADGYDFDDDNVAVRVVIDKPVPLADGLAAGPRLDKPVRFAVTSGIPSQLLTLRKHHPEILGLRVRDQDTVLFSDLSSDVKSSYAASKNGAAAYIGPYLLETGGHQLVFDRLGGEAGTEMIVDFDRARLVEPERVLKSGWAFYVEKGTGEWHPPYVFEHHGEGGKRIEYMEVALDAVGYAVPEGGELATFKDANWVHWRVYSGLSSESTVEDLSKGARAMAMVRADELYAPLTWFRVEVYGSLLASLLIAAWLAYFLSGRLVGAVDRIRGGVEALSRGEWTQLDKLSEDELGGGLVESVNHMAAALAERTRREEIEGWRRLVRVLSHEINNTLGPVRSVAVTVRDQIANRVDAADAAEDLRLAFQLIVDRTDALTSFIAGYAELAKLPDPAPVDADVNAVVDGGARLFREQAEKGNIGFGVKLDPEVGTARIDKGQIERVIINVVKNAVEAAPPGGEVLVATARHGGSVEITVDDDGPGIALEARRHLFVPYFTTKPGGSGIGLALVRQIVLGHGGTVTAEDRPGGGTRVRVLLPVRGGNA
jgi:signal transduction histidine kinase